MQIYFFYLKHQAKNTFPEDVERTNFPSES